MKPNDDPGQEADENAVMLENLVTGPRDANAPLERIVFIQGGKVYGAHPVVRHKDFVRSLESEGMHRRSGDTIIAHLDDMVKQELIPDPSQ